jgi:hypothetical protein
MIPLFVSCVCEYCDTPPARETLYSGFVVWSLTRHKFGSRQYVFPSRAMAERWQAIRGPEDAVVREVWCAHPFRWHVGRGSIRNLRLADRLFEIYPDHRFEPSSDRAFLASDEALLPAADG